MNTVAVYLPAAGGQTSKQLAVGVKLISMSISAYWHLSRYWVEANGVPLGEVEQESPRQWRATSHKPVIDPVTGKLANRLFYIFTSRRQALAHLIEYNLKDPATATAMGLS